MVSGSAEHVEAHSGPTSPCPGIKNQIKPKICIKLGGSKYLFIHVCMKLEDYVISKTEEVVSRRKWRKEKNSGLHTMNEKSNDDEMFRLTCIRE